MYVIYYGYSGSLCSSRVPAWLLILYCTELLQEAGLHASGYNGAPYYYNVTWKTFGQVPHLMDSSSQQTYY